MFDSDTDTGDTMDGTLPEMPDDSVALSGDFAGWYEGFYNSLVEEWPLGHEVVYRDSVGYEIVAARNDHPLFTSEGLHAYYKGQGKP